MAQRVNLVDRPGMNRVISRLMDHFGIRYTSRILDEVTLLQHFRKVNSARNENGVPNNPDNPDGVPFPIRVLPEQEVGETKNKKISEEVVVDERIEIKHRTKTETKKSRTAIRKTILITKTTFSEKSK